MDDLDRLYRRVVHNIRSTRPEYFKIPFTVRELYEQIIPYRHNRRELAIETNDDYETALARLLSGERGYVQADAALQEALRLELASPTGEPGVFKEHGDATISLASGAESTRTPVPSAAPAGMMTPAAVPTAVPTASNAPAQPARAAETPASRDVMAAFDAMAPAVSTPSAPHSPVPTLLDSLSANDVNAGCRFCGGTLPEGRDANFCPHCGENLRTKRCPACGAEMDTSWQFCVTCGRRAT